LYELKDLEILESQKSFDEFFEHARDIRPSKRDDYWKKMLDNMAEAYSLLLTQEQVKQASLEKLNDLLQWPELKTNEFFRINRQKAGLKYFSNCYRTVDAQTCSKQLFDFWRQDTSLYDFGIQLGKLAQKNDSIELELLWELYKEGLQHESSAFYCKEEHVRSLAEFFLLNLRKEYSVNPACEKVLRDFFAKKVSSARDPWPIRKRYLDYLIIKEKSGSEQDFYLALFLLSNPAPQKGAQLNKAWTLFERLHKDPVRREKLLEKLRLLDPLPDAIFSIESVEKRKAFANLIYDSFPEYIDLYAKTCLDYLKGKNKFPNGTPCLNSRSFFEELRKRKDNKSQQLAADYEKTTNL